MGDASLAKLATVQIIHGTRW